MLGAGTVLDPQIARTCKRYSKVICPGALTPADVVTAPESGAAVIKIPTGGAGAAGSAMMLSHHTLYGGQITPHNKKPRQWSAVLRKLPQGWLA